MDKRSYEQTRSRTAPIVHKMRKRLDFDARHWRNYIAPPPRNLKYRVQVCFFYDLTKAAAAYHASGRWDDHLRRQGVVQPVFSDEEHPLSENLEQNRFFQSSFMRRLNTIDRHLGGRMLVGRASTGWLTKNDREWSPASACDQIRLGSSCASHSIQFEAVLTLQDARLAIR